jgi:hypothetical protein
VARHRDIAASPVRTAAEAWAVIRELIAVTLERSDDIDGDDVRRTLDGAAPAGTAVIAAGYTGTADITVVATPLHLTIRTVGGTDAFKAQADENLNPVPGAATAQDWVVHLPNPAGLASLIEGVVATSAHLSAGTPPPEASEARSSSATTIDLRRLDPSRRT